MYTYIFIDDKESVVHSHIDYSDSLEEIKNLFEKGNLGIDCDPKRVRVEKLEKHNEDFGAGTKSGESNIDLPKSTNVIYQKDTKRGENPPD